MIDDFYEPTLGDYLKALWRRKWILAVGALAGIAVLLVAPIGRGGDYSSDVTFQIDDTRAIAENAQLGLITPNASSATAESGRALSKATMAKFRASNGHEASVASSTDEPNDQFTLTFTAPTADAARDDALQFSGIVVERRAGSQKAALADAIDVASAQLKEQADERDRLAAQLDAAGAAPSASLSIQSTAAAEAAARLQQRVAGLTELAELNDGGVSITGDVSDPVATSAWGTSTRIGIGLVLGLIGGAVVVMVLTAADRRLRMRRDVELVAGSAPVLGVIDRHAGPGLVAASGLALRHELQSRPGIVTVLATDDAADSDRLVELLSTHVGDTKLDSDGDVLGHAAQDADRSGELVLVAANARTTTDASLNAGLTLLADLGAEVVGIVLIDVDPRDLPGAAASIVTDAPAPSGTGASHAR